jgi:hypothetical protein
MRLKIIALATVAASLLASPASADTLYYCLAGRHDRRVEADFKASFASGWKTFQALVGRDDPQPELVYSTDTAKLRIYVYPDERASAAAYVRMSDPPVMHIHYPSLFGKYAPERKEKVLAHELCHFYIGLPDQYHQGDVIRDDCVMGNFVQYGWFGRFCRECRDKVAAYYREGSPR